MQIEKLDHIVLTVRNIEKTCVFYTKILGMKTVTFGNNRKALIFGKYKINLHEFGKEFEPHAGRPMPGSADLCLITRNSLRTVVANLHASNVVIVTGPVKLNGATGPIESVYFRDPDENLIEVSKYL